ncbi:lipase (class 3) [Tahibacter aquaticus]|uniref:Lipase (Class 3) n=1 Tax=Tahibacter aquaticus TaxID=520092 RepID=A0A4R6YMV9_9GAMM|nr:lipase family protein [Tahibacter aquaticus]TDR38751.1 lipase (class 3) [Tahibacter aquaticus]
MTAVFSTTGGTVVGQIGMTMASIAYAPDQATIVSLLADTGLATQGNWSLVWYASDTGNQVFVAQDKTSGQFCVAIRGSVSNPKSKAFWIDWFGQDLSVFRSALWPYDGAPDGARVSRGSLQGLGSLLTLKNAAGQDLVSFLRANADRPYLTAVVGHSLGGALATMLAAYLHQEFSPGQNVLDFWPVTFAGPTAGNEVFAGWLESQFAMTNSRYYNVDDVVPHAFAALDWIRQSFPGNPSLPLALVPLLDGIRGVLDLEHIDYTQPGNGVPLQGTIDLNDDWFVEAGLQHSGETYLALLGAPLVDNGS